MAFTPQLSPHPASLYDWPHAGVQEAGDLWQTPTGSNDDWYWLYGTVAARHRGVLISNDHMRDHIFELLRPRYFRKWRAHHQFAYDVYSPVPGAPPTESALLPPPVFTTCVQPIAASGAWMVPLPAGRWLCARPRLPEATGAA